jgi:hypothetical protein
MDAHQAQAIFEQFAIKTLLLPGVCQLPGQPFLLVDVCFRHVLLSTAKKKSGNNSVHIAIIFIQANALERNTATGFPRRAYPVTLPFSKGFADDQKQALPRGARIAGGG